MSPAKTTEGERVVCETPTPGKKPTTIERWKYDAVRQAILAVLPTYGAGIPFKELPAEVEAALPPKDRERLGSVMWYTTTVKLDMEVKGEIRRKPGSGPQRLVRC